MGRWTIESLGQALRNKTVTIEQVAQSYIDRIMEEDVNGPNAVITLNPLWKEDAALLQAAMDEHSPVLHGIPVLIKDNIDTVAMGNSAGSIALHDIPVEQDAPLITQLKAAGALILGKTNLSEWANFRSTNSVSGWSSLGGQTRNAVSAEYNPSGSSSGSAAAVFADFAVAAIGTETDGSIVSPAAHNAIIGLKPTVGRIPRTGIIPIAWSQDTAGPMTKTVTDAARLLDVLTNTDADDPVTLLQPKKQESFTQYCQTDFLRGKRIGYLLPDERFPAMVAENFSQVIHQLESAGALCIALEPVPTMVTLQDHEITQMCCEFPEALASYIRTRRPLSAYKNLADFAEFNRQHADTVMPLFKQEWFDRCLQMPSTTSQAYHDAQDAIELFRHDLRDLWFKEHDLDAVVTATNGPAWRLDPTFNDSYTGGNSYIAAVSGWPSITVPYTFVEGLPLGALFIAQPWEEAELLGIAFGFEQRVQASKEKP